VTCPAVGNKVRLWLRLLSSWPVSIHSAGFEDNNVSISLLEGLLSKCPNTRELLDSGIPISKTPQLYFLIFPSPLGWRPPCQEEPDTWNMLFLLRICLVWSKTLLVDSLEWNCLALCLPAV
jgi:hypothetical protein